LEKKNESVMITRFGDDGDNYKAAGGSMGRGARVVRAAIVGLLVVVVAAAVAEGQAAEKRAINFKDLISLHRLSQPQFSPDGKWIAYSVATPDLEANHLVRDIWVVPAAGGGGARQLTRGGSDTRARWSPDGRKLAFISGRSGTPQIYWIALEGGEATRLTSLSTGADNELWSPDGKTLAFVSSVYPDCRDDACNAARDAEKEKTKVKARIYEKLLYRHWTEWWDGKRSHLFVAGVDGTSVPRDLTAGANYDVPPFNEGAPEAIAFSADGRELCFTANTDKDEALSTNGDLFTVDVAGGGEPKRITTNPGNDWGPAYSPDGKWIAYRAQFLAGYEADRWRLMLYDRSSGKIINRTEDFDRSVESYAWTPDSARIYFSAEDKAEMPLYAIAAAGGSAPKVLGDGYNADFDLSRDGRTLAMARTNLTMPAEIFTADAGGGNLRQVTHQNGALLAQLELPAAEPFWFEGAEQAQVEGFLIRPPHFDATKKYPTLFLIHGGPQGAWMDAWGYRWNQQVMAAPGYVVVMVNPRGSTGYGQKFTAEISRDWGGKVYDDLMKGLDAAIAKYPFIDGTRVGAAGGSYGGYMIDWIATHTDRFKCLISHAGPYDLTSEYGATEELWFADWEFGGPPWSKPELYRKWAPSEYAAALGKYKTPTLVVGGELDFRVPYNQDLEFFTALQVQGVPSKLVIFPDEGHWVLKPQNSELWYGTFLDWLGRYLH
jgi:dipeptidyl aminopeptidase/acylaminoacyl peptidase